MSVPDLAAKPKWPFPLHASPQKQPGPGPCPSVDLTELMGLCFPRALCSYKHKNELQQGWEWSWDLGISKGLPLLEKTVEVVMGERSLGDRSPVPETLEATVRSPIGFPSSVGAS